MSCGYLALLNGEYDIECYHAYEIDKYAIKTSKHNFPNIIHHGDVFEGDFKQYKDFDILIGGSPCTYWSIAQSPDKREKTASGIGWDLFTQYVRALRKAKPKYFIYENNKSMSKAIYQSISNTFGFEPIMINSALVSAQNRKRYYWVGKRNKDDTYSKVDVKQPQDKGIMLKDILDGIDLTTKERHQRNMVCEPVRAGTYPTSDGRILDSQGMRIYSHEGKSVSQLGRSGGLGAKTGLYAIPVLNSIFKKVLSKQSARKCVNTQVKKLLCIV